MATILGFFKMAFLFSFFLFSFQFYSAQAASPIDGCQVIIDSGGTGDTTGSIITGDHWGGILPIGTSNFISCQASGASCFAVPHTYPACVNNFTVTAAQLANGHYIVDEEADDACTVLVNGTFAVGCGTSCMTGLPGPPAPTDITSLVIAGTNVLSVQWTDTIHSFTGLSYELVYCLNPTATSTSTCSATPTYTPTQTATSTNTPLNTVTNTVTNTTTPTISNTVTCTATVTTTATSTPSPTPTCSIYVWPDPYNPHNAVGGTLRFSCMNGATLDIFTISGESVQTLTSNSPGQPCGGNVPPAWGSWYCWNGRNSRELPVATGVYFYVVHQGTQLFQRGKFLLVNGP